RAAEIAVERGVTPAVYVSGNVQGGRERNEAVIARYRNRIRFLLSTSNHCHSKHSNEYESNLFHLFKF
ncbi:MAG: hypothetical protein IIW98_07790, partial [Bacteroidaceae bacterium]|nr:hypothetical protein [Bacteroidaceae bacterium]